jgi:predicted nucleic acid-binding Zn ribbon protein
MSLFKRKAAADDVTHCPVCGERVPEGAVNCAMCGNALPTPPDDRAAAADTPTRALEGHGAETRRS